MNDTPASHTPLGQAAFESLRAEEEPWLKDCFVPPPGAEQLLSDRSIIIFGAPGSGKSALSGYLHHQARQVDDESRRLVARWEFSLLQPDDLAGLAAVKVQAQQVLHFCVEALLNYLAHHPASFQNATSLTQEVLGWFVQEYFQGQLEVRLGQIIREQAPAGEPVLRALLAAPPRQILPPTAPADQVAVRLVRALRPLGLQGVWVVADNLEGWADMAPNDLATDLKLFLSTLPLFEKAHFSYKLFVPLTLDPVLSQASAMVRHRVAPYHLNWPDAALLRQVVERRLALALGQPTFTLGELCAAPGLWDWLVRVGAGSPREWLEQVKPLLGYYLAHNLDRPISREKWLELRAQHPPRFYFDEANKRVVVGARRISLAEVSAIPYAILCYLYERPNQVISRGELYFKIHKQMDHVPVKGDPQFEGSKEYRGAIDTAIWRLRQVIEPDPGQPVLIVTIKGHGVQLKIRW